MNKLKPRNESQGGMARSGIACGNVSGVEQSRLNLGSFYEKLRGQDHADIMDNFIWFIKEREKIRELKDSGSDRPYTDDEILHRTRFTNIFREDDKVSRFMFSKLAHLNGSELFYNLLISRLLNRVDILSDILPTSSTDDISFILSDDNPIMNSMAYQISPGMVRYNDYTTVREYIIYETPSLYMNAYNEMLKGKTVSEASGLANKGYGGNIPFVMFQVVLDWNYLVGGFEDSPVIRVGQGAKATIDALMDNMVGTSTPTGKLVASKVVDITPLVEAVNERVDRKMKPSDVEHACCEYRKYLQRQGKQLSRYSYKPNSMGIQDEVS